MNTVANKTLATLLTSAALVLLPGLASASDLTGFKTVFDTDFVSAGVGGMRGIGSGTIALSGVSGPVSEAYLFWHGPTNAAATNTAANANVTFNGTDISGTFLGISNDNCWGFANSMAYRANVSSLITGNGNYTLTNFIKQGVDINGASLVVFYQDGNSANNRDVVMFNGNDSNISNPFDALGWNILLSGINYTSGNANAQFHVADGQTFADAAVIANGTEIAPAGAVFNGETVPNGNDNRSQTLWDIKDFNVTSLLNPGLNNLNIVSGTNNDCLACVMIAIDLPAGAAPDQPGNSVPEPGTLVLAGMALLGLGATRNRRQKALS